MATAKLDPAPPFFPGGSMNVRRDASDSQDAGSGIRDVNAQSTSLVRVGAVAYLNTKPLIHGLESRLTGRASLSLELPSRLASEMERGALDVGLIPVVEYFQHLDAYQPVSDAVIACCGPVWSVRILFRKPPSQVRTLAVDEGSRTSVALSKVLFHSRFDWIPETVPFRIDATPESTEADAVLVIGDRAMKPERFRSHFETDWDLGEEWFRETGLPFVFARWVARRAEFASDWLTRCLESSRDSGQRDVEHIVAQHAVAYGLTADECRDYLTHYLQFRLGDRESAGLREFHRRCVSLGLVPESTAAL